MPRATLPDDESLNRQTQPPDLAAFDARVDNWVKDAPLGSHDAKLSTARIAALSAKFWRAMRAKMILSQAKNAWADDASWYGPKWGERDCERGFIEHLRKGDPLDVAIFAAFAWFHGWKTTHYLTNALGNEAREAVSEWRETILKPFGDDEGTYALDLALTTANSTTVDPESDLAVLSRQFIRAREELASYHSPGAHDAIHEGTAP